MSLQVYTVHEPRVLAPGSLQRAEQVVFVKEGFAPFALLFGPLWLIVQRMWLVLLAFIALWAIVRAVFWLVPGGTTAVGLVWFLISLGFAFEANALRRWTLERKGYRMLGSVTGRSLDECERRFFQSWTGRASLPAAPSGRPGPVSSTPPPLPSSEDQDISGRLKSVVASMRRNQEPLPPDAPHTPREAT